MPDLPRLTFPAREPGARRIMADGIQVGHCLANHRMEWTAYLWSVPGKPGEGFREGGWGANLREMREDVRGYLEAAGPWWTVPSETAATRESA